MPSVAVFHHTLEMRMVPDAGQNVFTMPIVPVEWLVFDNIAEILVQAFAVLQPNVLLLIMYQFAHALETMKVIHSQDVEKCHYHVSTLFSYLFD